MLVPVGAILALVAFAQSRGFLAPCAVYSVLWTLPASLPRSCRRSKIHSPRAIAFPLLRTMFNWRAAKGAEMARACAYTTHDPIAVEWRAREKSTATVVVIVVAGAAVCGGSSLLWPGLSRTRAQALRAALSLSLSLSMDGSISASPMYKSLAGYPLCVPPWCSLCFSHSLCMCACLWLVSCALANIRVCAFARWLELEFGAPTVGLWLYSFRLHSRSGVESTLAS